MSTYEPISGIETLDAQGRVLYCETDGLGDPCIVIGAANGEEEITVALPGMALCRVVDDGNLTMLQRAHRALQAAQSGNPDADLFYRDVELYAAIAQAEAQERQAAAAEDEGRVPTAAE